MTAGELMGLVAYVGLGALTLFCLMVAESKRHLVAIRASALRRALCVESVPRHALLAGDTSWVAQEAQQTVTLGVAAGGDTREVLAMASHDYIIIRDDVAEMSREQRLLIIAHEIGHVALGHALKGLIAERILGCMLKPQAQQWVMQRLHHRFEHEADLFACRLLARMGIDGPSVAEALYHSFEHIDQSHTHPSAAKRIAVMRNAMH